MGGAVYPGAWRLRVKAAIACGGDTEAQGSPVKWAGACSDCICGAIEPVVAVGHGRGVPGRSAGQDRPGGLRGQEGERYEAWQGACEVTWSSVYLRETAWSGLVWSSRRKPLFANRRTEHSSDVSEP
ncbi:hypothetical protein ACE1SV_75360 [Streptomyces sennicomposti]